MGPEFVEGGVRLALRGEHPVIGVALGVEAVEENGGELRDEVLCAFEGDVLGRGSKLGDEREGGIESVDFVLFMRW